MGWIAFALASGVLNALWTSRIKPQVQARGPLAFAASIRWGVALLLVPWALAHTHSFSPRWWAATCLTGVLESLSLFLTVRGFRKDYYSTFSLSNTSPLFVVLLAWAFLGEPLGLTLMEGSVLIVGGSLLLYYRGHWSWWGLGAALAVSLSKVLSKSVIQEGDPLTQACLAFLAGAFFLSLLTSFQKERGTRGEILRGIWGFKYLVLASALTTVCFFEAVSLGSIGPVSLLSRVNLVAGFALSYFSLREKQGWRSRAAGAALILLGIGLVLWKH